MLIKYIKTSLILCLFLVNSQQNTAQTPLQDTLQTPFTTYQQNNLQEKLFVHTDRNGYLAGDICWFKIYNVESFFHTPLSISKVVYVEILDKNNQSVLQAKVPMTENGGNGSFFLPASLLSGHYKFRAYTNWMKNYSADYFFEKTITIINSKAVYEADTVPQKDTYHLTFFPEGGNLVTTIQSTIAFHIINQNGKGLDGSGVVLNDKNDTITTFKTVKFGMGSFVLTPQTSQIYKAIVTLSNGQKITQALPNVYSEGYVLHLEDNDNQTLKITVKATNTQTKSIIYLFAHTRGVPKAVLSATIQDGQAIFLINKNKLGDGISHFTVFNAAKQPVCERLYFKYPKNYLQIDIGLDAPTYGLRKKINIHTSIADKDGQPISTNMSMAVYRLDSLQNLDEMDINNYLWLSSDLVGTIESPNYYFSNNEPNRGEAIDNLMLTHGWRRFKWEDILYNKQPTFEFIPEYVGHLVTGKITKRSPNLTANKEPIEVKNREAYLSMPNSKMQLRTTVSDNQGRIKFDIKDFYPNGSIIVQAKNGEDSLYNVTMDNPFIKAYSNKRMPVFALSTINAAALTSRHTSMEVQNKYLNQKLKQVIEPIIDTYPFYKKPDTRYLLDDYVRFTTLEEVLIEYVTPVSLKRYNNKVHLQVWDEHTKKFFDDNPLVLLDGTPVDINKLINYDPLKIKQLDVVSRMYFLSNTPYYGLLNFKTYTNQMPDFEFDPHTTVIDDEGLQKQRIFYAPEYATQEQISSRLPDFRHLLYWSPNVKTKEKGKNELSFYSSDIAGKYIVVLQGISADGKTGSDVKVFDVK